MFCVLTKTFVLARENASDTELLHLAGMEEHKFVDAELWEGDIPTIDDREEAM
jgi:hypothetical protein